MRCGDERVREGYQKLRDDYGPAVGHVFLYYPDCWYVC